MLNGTKSRPPIKHLSFAKLNNHMTNAFILKMMVWGDFFIPRQWTNHTKTVSICALFLFTLHGVGCILINFFVVSVFLEFLVVHLQMNKTWFSFIINI